MQYNRSHPGQIKQFDFEKNNKQISITQSSLKEKVFNTGQSLFRERLLSLLVN